MRLTRRLFGAASMLCLAALAVDAQAAEPKRGGTLNVIVDLEPASMDPIFGNAPGSDRRFFNLFAENLISQDVSGNMQPALAESWAWSDDGKSITFKLRPGVVFHDGTPFDAEAVKFNFDRVSDPQVGARALQYVGNLASTEVIDPLTVKVNLKEPSAAFLATVIAVEPGMIVSPTAVKSMGADFARKPVGTGPFKVVAWTSGNLETERFDRYWKKDVAGQSLPYVDRVVARVVSNTAVKLAELKGNGAQLGDTIQVKDFEQVERDGNLVLVDNNQGPTQYISFNNTKPPFDNVELRKAVTFGINRAAIEKAVSRGQGTVLMGLEAPTSWASGPELKGHPYDPEAAKAAYAKSGHKGPITLSVIQRDPDTQIAQLLQAMLKQVGIELKIEVMERQAWVEKTLSYNYEMGILRATMPRPDPDLSFSTYYGKEAKQDYSGIKSPYLWETVAKARTELDQNVRRKLYIDMQNYILDNYYQTFLFWRPTKEIARKSLRGFSREFSGAWVYSGMWLDS